MKRETWVIARREVARAVGNDYYYLLPPDQRHFDAISAVLGFFGCLLGAFLAGFVEQSREHAKDLGSRTASWFFKKGLGLLLARGTTEPTVEDPELTEAIGEIDGSAGAVWRSSALEKRKQLLTAVQEETRRLLVEHGMPVDRATVVAEAIRTQATRVIEDTGGPNGT